MQTHNNELAILPQPAAAANEELSSIQRKEASSGWNAYEIWRTRIKSVYDSRGASLLTPRAPEKSNVR